MEYYRESAKKVLERFKTSKEGLNNSKAKKRLSKYGFNEIQNKNKHKILHIFIDQLKDFLVILLLAATILSFFLGDLIEAFAMLVMIVLTVLLGFFQEYKAEKSLEKLKKITSQKAIVIRDGEETKINANELVPGDIVVLEAGSIVPADLRLINVSSLKIDEASLTGESEHTYKKLNINSKKDLTLADQANMAFMGTVVVYGKAKGIVVRTGMDTEFGKIASSLNEVKDEKTPMKKKLAKLGTQLIIAVIVICVVVFISSFLQGDLTLNQAFMVALSLAVAAAPTSLPAIVTISLSKGVVRLAKKNMLVKKLPAAEGLGAATYICSDKTGTLTKNQMSVKKVFANNKLYSVEGVGYLPKGDVLYKGKRINEEEIDKLLDVCLLCNDSELILKNNKYEIIGDPTEAALIVLAKKLGLTEKEVLESYDIFQDLPFDSDRKMMSVVVENHKYKFESLTKGAPQFILDKCNKILINDKISTLNSAKKKKILKNLKNMEKNALRVIGLAYRPLKKKKKYSIKDVENDMIFLGLIGMIDPPRDSIKESISKCKKAGIDVMMITGDSALTAKAIGKEIGLLDKKDLVIDGEELNKLSDNKLKKKISKLRICARFLPIQKLRIVDALQKKGEVVAMTGDGVNDAPALKKADLGIAMGITGTDVSKEVSEMTLTDDNFSSIVSAIEEGRNIYDKMIKSIKYLLTCNAGELLTVFVALLLNFPIPLLPLQILLMNLLTDGLPALALSMDPSDSAVMNRRPRDPQEKPVTSGMLWLILIFGGLMAAGSLFLFNHYLNLTNNLPLAQTIAFTTLVAFEMFAVISSRKLYTLSFSKGFFSNKYLHLAIISSLILQFVVIYVPFMQSVFGTAPLKLIHWIHIIGVSFLGFIIMELSKLFIKYDSHHSKASLKKKK